jgi:hypothetical protein
MIRRAPSLLLAIAFVGSTAACGGGEGDEKAKADSTDREEGEVGDAASTRDSTTPSGEDAAGSDSTTEPDHGTRSVVTAAPIPEYTGTGSAAFCRGMASLQGSMQGTEPASVDYAALADDMAAVDPPPELTTDWGLFVETQKLISSDPTGATMENLDQATLTACGQASSDVEAYLVRICGL